MSDLIFKRRLVNYLAYLRKRVSVRLRQLAIFSRRRSRSIVDRVLGILLVWSVLVYFVAIAGVWWGSTSVIEDNFSNQATEWLRKLDELGTPLYISKDKTLFRSIEDHVSQFPEIAYLRYYESDNNTVLAEYYSKEKLVRLVPPLSLLEIETVRLNVESAEPVFIDSAKSRLSLVQAAVPVVIRSIQSDGLIDLEASMVSEQLESYKIIGFIELGLDFSLYRKKLVKNIILGSLVIAAMFFLMVIAGRFIIKKSLRPLMNLRRPLAKLAKGDINVHVESEGDDEIVAIANALNTTIAALKGRDKELRQLANYDPLTGLLNKSIFNMLLKREVERVKEDNDSSALLFIDLDQFKHVNDNLGHAAGDRLLVQIAELLKSRMRREDMISRFGGDEFTVIASSVTAKDARLIADSILKSMQNFVFVENEQSFNIYCSIGVVMMNADTMSDEEVFSQADMACFQAKSAGRNCYHMFDAVKQAEIRKVADISWSKRIKEAIDENKFTLYYQPIVPLDGGNKQCYEVLLRMMFDGEIMLPNAFLSAAQRLGMIVDIDSWVVRNALKKISELTASDQEVLFSINLSGASFEDAGFIIRLKKYIKEYKVDPSLIIFEITEQTAVKNIDFVGQVMHELVAMGCRFALDDFGIGFHSFEHLKTMPVDYLKINGDFIANMANDEVDQAMVQFMIRIARILNKKVIAGHVQDSQALELLKEFGADYAQGFYLGKPEPLLGMEHFKKSVKLVLINGGNGH
ncbi:MAG: EAL domain-containing protein [Gammaproteobacteria bacterium]|nr:EAL domain-containing protein [Gammaproteobacteria bacterium]